MAWQIILPRWLYDRRILAHPRRTPHSRRRPVFGTPLRFIATVWASIALFPSGAWAQTAAAGDLAPLSNPDGVLNAADFMILQRMVLGSLSPTQAQLRVGDVAPLGAPDGELNAGDLVVLMRAVNGEIILPDVYLGPDAPVLYVATSPTTENPYAFSGAGEPNTEIRLYIDGALTNTTLTGTDGSFTVAAVLSDGINLIHTTAYAGGIESEPSNVLSVDYRNQQPRQYTDTSIAATVVWSPGTTPAPYIVEGTLTIPLGSTLIIRPGTEIRFGFGARFNVLGDLLIQGTAQSPVLLTSDSPDPRRGDWLGVIIDNTAGHVQIDHALIQWAANGVAIYGGTDVLISNSTIRDSAQAGIYVAPGASPRIVGNTIDQVAPTGYVAYIGSGIEVDSSDPIIQGNHVRNHDIGVYVKNHASPTIDAGNTIEANRFGIYLQGDYSDPENNPTPVVTGNNIYSNSSYGLAAEGWATDAWTNDSYSDLLEIELDISGNWWGSSNPSSVSASVAPFGAYGPVLRLAPFLDAEGGDPLAGNFLSGLVTTNQQLASGSQHVVVGDLVITRAASLSIDAGSSLLFARHSAITALGTFVAIGTLDNKIQLDSLEPIKVPGDWQGISLYGDNSLVNNTVVRHARRAIDIYGRYASISHSTLSDFSLDGIVARAGSTADISYNQIHGTTRTGNGLSLHSSEVMASQNQIIQTNYGIFVSASSPTLQGNDISDNSRGIYIQKVNTGDNPPRPTLSANRIYANDYGIYLSARRQLTGEPDPAINNNEIHSNNQYNLFLSNFNPASIVNAAQNWWGTENEAEILAGFNDPYRVLYSPYKNAAGDSVTASSLLGVISEPRVLAGGQTYHVDTMIIQQGASLTIGAGARLEFPYGAQLVVNGDLIIDGTEEAPVVFTRASGASSWNGIYLNSPNAVLHDFVVEYARESLHAVAGPVSVYDAEFRFCLLKCVFFEGQYGNRMALDVRRVRIDAGGPTIDGVVIHHGRGTVAGSHIANANQGMYLYGTNYALSIDRNSFVNNVYGIAVSGATYYPNTPAANDNNFSANSDKNYWTGYYSLRPDTVLDATNNWWGTELDPDIQASIWDEEDVGANMPKVTYLPYRSEPVPMPPRLDALPGLHSDELLAVTGHAEPNQALRVYLNGGGAATGMADSLGAFSIPVSLSPGNNDIHVVSYRGATESYPSRSYQVVRDVDAPVITLVSPVDGAVTNQYAVSFTGSLSEPATLTIGGNTVALDANNAFSHGPVYLAEGANAIALVATDVAGNVTTQTVHLMLDSTPPADPVPTLIDFDSSSGSETLVSGAAGSVQAGTVITLVNVRTGQTSRIAAATDGSFALSIGSASGDDLALIAADDLGNQSTWLDHTVTGTAPVLALVIASPVNSATVSGDTVHVVGTVTGPANTGVVVNGVIANIEGGQFVATDVPVVAGGPTTLTVTATDPEGATVNESLVVNGAAGPPVELSVTPDHGLSPLPVTFNLERVSPFEIGSVEIDLDGDGVYDLTGPDITYTYGQDAQRNNVVVSATASHTYLYPGLYTVRVRVQGSGADSGVSYALDHPVLIQDAIGAGSNLRRIYQRMLDNLSAGNPASALTALSQTMQDKFTTLFTDPAIDFSLLVPELGEIVGGGISGDVGFLVVKRNDAGQYLYHSVYFNRGSDGVWRIGEM